MKTAGDRPLRNTRILVAEDDMILAFDLIVTLRQAGAEIVGPAATLKHALFLAKTPLLSAAVLDVNLGNEEVFRAASALEALGVGIVFYTGYILRDLGGSWPKAQVLSKPAPPRLLIKAVSQACELYAHSVRYR
jgi:DNA-binding NarL/FixJ family response regulator